jgi:hypothetical protein
LNKKKQPFGSVRDSVFDENVPTIDTYNYEIVTEVVFIKHFSKWFTPSEKMLQLPKKLKPKPFLEELELF